MQIPEDLYEEACSCCDTCREIAPEQDISNVVWYNIQDGEENGGEIYIKRNIEDFDEYMDCIIIPMIEAQSFSKELIETRIKY